LKRTIFNINRIECKKTSDSAIKNADRLFDSAEKLHLSGDNGLAISHLIIGSEELIKALILHFDSIGFNFRQVKGLQNIFENHQLRYFISFLLFTMSVFIDEINFFIKKVNRNKSGFQLLDDLNQKMKNDEKAFQQKLTTLLIAKLEFLLTEISWFNNFDLFRQKGFYVDYIDEIETPLKASESDYLSIKIRVDKIRNSLLEIISGLNKDSEPSTKSLDKIFETFKKEDIYKKIENFLKNSKSKTDGPLDYTANTILPFLR